MSSTTERLGRAVLACGLCLALGCGDDDGGEPPASDNTQASLPDALTKSMRFENGTVKLGDIGGASNDTVMLFVADDRVELAPGGASLLAFEVDNPVGSEPVEAVLLQFADAVEHIEVAQQVQPAAEPVSVMLDFSIDEAVCEGLCNQQLAITLSQAVRLADGAVSRIEPITVTLDCTGTGDADACGLEPAPTPDAGPPSAMDAGPDPGPAAQDVTALSMELSTAFAAAHDALCTSCADPSRVPCFAIVPTGAITCIEEGLLELTGTPELVAALQTLTEHVQGVTTSCESCDLAACAPSLIDDALPSFPPEAMTVIETCVAD